MDPATQKVLSRTPRCSIEELEMAAKTASEAFSSWKRVNCGGRLTMVVTWGDRYLCRCARGICSSMLSSYARCACVQVCGCFILLSQDMDNLARIVSDELGKTLEDAKGSVGGRRNS